MPILDANGNPVTSSQTTFANAANRYDRAQPPEPLFLADFDKLVPDMDRKALLSGGRKIYQNFPPVTGAIDSKADHVVGRAWDPKFTGKDREWGTIASDWLKEQWFGFCDVSGPGTDFKTLLWLDCVALDRDGDELIVLIKDSDYPLTQRIPANRIGQRRNAAKYGEFTNYSEVEKGPFKGARIRQGVITDKFGRRLGYRVLGDTESEDRDIAAEDCIFISDPQWHNQFRGVTAMSTALKFLRGALLSHEWEQMAQLMVSSIGLVEYNEHGGPDIDDPSITAGKKVDDITQPTIETLQGGMVRYFRSNSGGKVEQVEHNRPGDMWDRFQDRMIRFAMAGLKWPYELSWKASEVNSSLVRNIQERARMTVEDRQDTLRVPALRLIRWAVAKAIKNKIIPAPSSKDDWWRWEFGMPRKFSIDAGRDAQQRRADLDKGITNRTKIAIEEGNDVEQLEDERIEEVFRRARKIKAAKEANPDVQVDDREFFMLTANDQPVVASPPKDDEEDKPDDKE
jgi:capsid protein